MRQALILIEYVSLLITFIGAGGLAYEIWRRHGWLGMRWVVHCALVATCAISVLALRIKIYGAHGTGPEAVFLLVQGMTWLFFLRNFERYEALP